MTSKKENGPEALTAESAERTIRYVQENGSLCLTAYFEAAGRQLPCTIDQSWEIHGVTLKENEFSFVASKRGQQAAIKFYVNMREFIESLKKWFAEAAKTIGHNMKHLTATIPNTIVFVAGPTEYVGQKIKPA